MGQIVEGTLVHGGPDLPLDERLADAFARRFGGIGTFGVAFQRRHMPSLSGRLRDRQGVAPSG